AVPLVDQHVPERVRVLAPRNGDEHVLIRLEHAVLPDGLANLFPEEVEEVQVAEGGVVATQLEHRRPAALPALHCNGVRAAGPVGGWPETRCGLAPFHMALLIPPGAARAAHSGGWPAPGAIWLPPLMTGLSSMMSASRTTWSGVISSSPRITR